MLDAVHPGTKLQEVLDGHSVGQIVLSIDTGLSAKTINSIIKGKTGLSANVAVLLEQYLPPHPAEYWLELDYKWRLAQARAERNKETA